LRGLIEEAVGDIVLRLDCRGFILDASRNIGELGLDVSAALIQPHLTDLVGPDYRSHVSQHLAGILRGETGAGWIEFPAIASPEPEPEPACRSEARQRWYGLSLSPLTGEAGTTEGALGLMRSVQHLRRLEGELHNRAITDPLTGLPNRQAFCASLRRHLAGGGGQIMALFAIDSIRTLGLRYGQRSADEILWGFARFLETMALPGHELAHFDGERLAMLLPQMSAAAARSFAEDVVHTFCALALPGSGRGPQLTVSAGLARVECTVDWVLREAETSLVLARASGGGCVAQARHSRAA
jgi:diguanylate cyclase (GGDEF)-like protein